MDLDLLRPTAVSITSDTVLGFEFLLDKNLLIKHLEKPNADPPPADLITKFYDAIATNLRNNMDTENAETTTEASGNGENKTKHPTKNIAMKILALKVAAYLKWNLAQIRSLPFKTQISILQDLMYFTSDEKATLEISNFEQPDTKTAASQFLFALLIFHRWLLNTSMHRVTSNWQQRYGMNEMTITDETIICCPDNIKKTITFLNDALQWEEIPLMLTFDCFKMPTEENDSIEFHWDKGQIISKEEFRAQICYDLGIFFFYQEDYETAKRHFFQCLTFFNGLGQRNGFATFDQNILSVYLQACDPNVEVQKKTLSEQLNYSVVNQFVGITNVLQLDNVQREIPLSHRIILELNIQGALSSGVFTVARDLLFKVKALNYLRCILDGKFINEYPFTAGKSVDIFLWAIQVNWKAHSDEDKRAIKEFIFGLIIKGESTELWDKMKSGDILKSMFDKAEIQYLSKKQQIDIPDCIFKGDPLQMDSARRRKPKLELIKYSKQLIGSYDWKEIKDLLTKIGMLNLRTSVRDINPQWELPIPLESVVKSLPRGVLHDFTFVLLAKSREQLSNKNWNLALELLIVLDKELQSATCNVAKLSKMVNWEVLLIQVAQLIGEWPRSNMDKLPLADACESCLQTSESVLPRTEIVESCALCLLNLGRWDFLIGYEKRWTSFELISSLALSCNDFVKHKGTKKFPKDLWDSVLPVFGPNPAQQSKRGNYQDSSNLKSNLMYVLLKLKDSRCLLVVVSMLAKFYNIFKDEANLELQMEYMNLWPATVSNASSYSVGTASEILSEVLGEALKEYPTNVPYLRLMGDVNFANGHYKISISYYLKSLIICNDYFNIPIRYDDHVFKRMIKCCQALGCHTQAAVLCQFLEEPDYSLAFRILGEQKQCNDAVDAYYHCFWDTNILEYLIHVHNRRGEFQRRKCATQIIGMLELNSNNNEEIQREASNLRKNVFLRALCKQYVF